VRGQPATGYPCRRRHRRRSEGRGVRGEGFGFPSSFVIPASSLPIPRPPPLLPVFYSSTAIVPSSPLKKGTGTSRLSFFAAFAPVDSEPVPFFNGLLGPAVPRE
jgi:hypothetical protein